jgi:hypothetical protein
MENEDLFSHPEYNIDFYFRKPSIQSFPLINSYNLIDSVIRTIRDLISKVAGNNPEAFANERLISRVINIYNNTVHSAYNNKYTPAQVQDDREIESFYTKHQQAELEKVKQLLVKDGFLTYEKGNILLVHVPLEKTPYG